MKRADKEVKSLFSFFIKDKNKVEEEENINSLVELFKKFHHPIPKPISKPKLESLQRSGRESYEGGNWEQLDLTTKEWTTLVYAPDFRSQSYRECLLMKISSEWKRKNKRSFRDSLKIYNETTSGTSHKSLLQLHIEIASHCFAYRLHEEGMKQIN